MTKTLLRPDPSVIHLDRPEIEPPHDYENPAPQLSPWQAGLLAAALAGHAADQANPDALDGVIDFHCHSSPDVSKRSTTASRRFETAKAAGMRALVLKNHYVSTAALAQLAMDEVGGSKSMAGIVLNRSNGGINAEAVRRDDRGGGASRQGGLDADLRCGESDQARPHQSSLCRRGPGWVPVPALNEIFQLIAKNDLIFATGHSRTRGVDFLILLDAARQAGVKRPLATHVLSASTRAIRLGQMKAMVAPGATLKSSGWRTSGTSPCPCPRCAGAPGGRGGTFF